MSDNLKLVAEPKERAGKGAARATRRAGRVPAVIYGDKKPPVMVSLEPRDLARHINSGGFFSTLFSGFRRREQRFEDVLDSATPSLPVEPLATPRLETPPAAELAKTQAALRFFANTAGDDTKATPAPRPAPRAMSLNSTLAQIAAARAKQPARSANRSDEIRRRLAAL